jgi:hypothetical protein
MAWIPTGGGKPFRPLRFDPDGWPELMRLEAGSLAASGELGRADRREARRTDLDTAGALTP